MNTIFNKQYILAALLLTATGMMTGCGDDDAVPAPEHTQTNPSITPGGTPAAPDVKEIAPSAIEEDAEEGRVAVRIAEQPGGRAELRATASETGAVAQPIVIAGTYDSETGCYTFDLTVLDGGVTYQCVISVYDKDGKKVMESKPKSVDIQESADIDTDGSEGGSDGTRGGVNQLRFMTK